MEQTVNVNEAVSPENTGITDQVKTEQPTGQPTLEELAEQSAATNTGQPEEPELTELSKNQPAGDTQAPEETVETTEELPVVPIEPELTPEEKIIDSWLQNGKIEVSMNELIEAGFDAEELDPQSNTIGCFKLSRILLVSPFRIEKINKETENI